MSKCEAREIEIRTGNRDLPRRVHAWCFGDFAIHKWTDGNPSEGWRLTHLPTGLLVAVGHWSRDEAIEAMIEVARLRNDWAVIKDEDLTDGLADQVSSICRNYNGFLTGGNREYRLGWNGYGAIAS
jgi:hypothetical protein